ncbi:GyrI-like domain-containing protein [Micromonospora zhanjiangensis]|uniref:GyrI-like domain-containing protein n=1 Tax=Micromonospora zhanjiangensis TaxID=1522057 RepID=A0ABV8KM81_9ACTN
MTELPRTDFKKTYRQVYAARATPTLVDVPELTMLAVDGVGDPEGPAYRQVVEALYGVAYTLRFGLKNAGVLEYPVMPLEGLWWSPGLRDGSTADRSAWHYTMMIMQPPQVTADLVADAVAGAGRKRPSAALDRVELRTLAEGPSAQILHVGPFSEEPATLDRLMAFIGERGLRMHGKHHEIYLSDHRRTAPEKLRTILRYPVLPPVGG